MNDAHLRLRGLRHGLHREPLAGVVLHAAEEYESDRLTLPLDNIENVLFAQGKFSWTRGDLDNRIRGLEAVSRHLRSKSILHSSLLTTVPESYASLYLIRRKRLGLAEDLVPSSRRLVERVDHQVQVRREGTHARDLGLLRTYVANTIS